VYYSEIVSIPGLRGREPKEISLRNLAHIIQARMEEIIEHVYYEIKNSGYEKKLIAGIVLTGGGAQLKHLAQLVEYMTGMDTRIGYPNEHLSKGGSELSSPMYATGVGLVIKGLQQIEKRNRKENPENVTTDQKQQVSKVAGHSEKDKKGGFFDAIRDFFKEDPQ
jgi:cell division protein FtsA